MKTRFYVSGITYDKNECITDIDFEYGDYDTIEEARNKLEELKKIGYYLMINCDEVVNRLVVQIEECEENEGEINCVEIHDCFEVISEE